MDWLQVAMLLWSYFACVLTDPGKTPEGWHPFESDEVERNFCASHETHHLCHQHTYQRNCFDRPHACRRLKLSLRS